MCIKQEDFELVQTQLRGNIRTFANNKEKIGSSYSQDQWDYWNSILEWDEVEKVEVTETRTIEIENLRLKEETNEIN